MRTLLFFALWFQGFVFGVSSGGPLSQTQLNMDIKHYGIHLDVDLDKKTINGFVDISIKLLDSTRTKIELDLIDNYTVVQIRYKYKNLPFTQLKHKIYTHIPTPTQTFQLRIYYKGTPPEAKRPPWEGGFTWTSDSLGNPWIGLSCQSDGAHIWMPCKEHPSDEADSVDVYIVVKKPLSVASNGLLVETINQGEKKIWHWKTRYPISPYNINFTIGKFDIIERQFELTRPTLAQYFVLAEGKSRANYILNEAEKYLKFYESIFGSYPWHKEKFGMVQTPYWGMEHQSIIAYGNNYKIREPGYDFLLLHEMGHEWWGNYLTVNDWADFWIHEGITIYAEALFIEENYGIEAYHNFFQKTVRKKISNQKAIIPKRNATASEVDGLDPYYKGAIMLHGLRYLIGKDTLLQILNEVLHSEKAMAHNHVSTKDFIRISNEISNRDLGWFFNQYLYKKELPLLKIKKRWKKTILSWDDPKFKMPIELEIKGKQTQKYTFETQTGKLIINSEKIKAVDPKNWLLYQKKRVFLK